ncbi:MAG: glycosyltransferase family 2 protein [Candidatus Neptunochlamydia sp.]|nr:glycosyltransferase family 2 protein [Candidatus Neptunochlamydia sp.]
MKIYVIILNWNGRDDTFACLYSLAKVKTPHEVVVVDNGSTDDSASAISTSFPDVYLIQTGENIGYAEGNNVGIRYALEKGADFVFILNNDTTVEPDILQAFLKRDALIQGGKAHLMSDPKTLDHLGGNWNSQKGEFDLIGAKAPASEWRHPISLDYVCGVALFVQAEVFRKVGLFEPRYFLFWEDSDFCIRAKEGGFSATVCPEAILYHKVSASFSGGKPHMTYFWCRNRLLWIERNCTANEKKVLMRKIRGDFFHVLKLYLLKSLQLLFSRKTKERRARLRTYRAQLAGIKDYFVKRFGNAPSWLFKK